MTPLGADVEPEVYCRKASVSAPTSTGCQASAVRSSISSSRSHDRDASLGDSSSSFFRRAAEVVIATRGRELC